MAKHAADNGGFFGLFRKKKEGYYDFTDTAKTSKKNDDYNDDFYSDLKKDYTALNYSDIEDNGSDIAYNNTTTLNNLSSGMDNKIKTETNESKEKESTQAVNTIEEVSANSNFDGKLYQGDTSNSTSYTDNTNSNNNVSSNDYSYNSNEHDEGTFVNGYEYEYQDYDEDDGGFKKILIFIIILLVVAAVSFYLLFFRKSNEPEEVPVEEEVVEQVEEKMTSSVAGFTVLGKINIESIGIEQYILDSATNEALENGVGRIDNGASLNTNGNFCIAGHNKEGVFKDLNSLVEGSEIVITDKDLNESTYVVKEFREVAPDNLECLLQDMTKEKITLVTCKEGATERYIVIAERK